MSIDKTQENISHFQNSEIQSSKFTNLSVKKIIIDISSKIRTEIYNKKNDKELGTNALQLQTVKINSEKLLTLFIHYYKYLTE